LVAPTITGSTTVNQTSGTLPTTGAQIGFIYTYKPASYTGLVYTLTTTLSAIPALTYTFPAIGVWMCVFQFTGVTIQSYTLTYGLSLNSTSMDTGWNTSFMNQTGTDKTLTTTRMISVSNLTTTLYCLVQGGYVYNVPTITNYTVQCVRIA